MTRKKHGRPPKVVRTPEAVIIRQVSPSVLVCGNDLGRVGESSLSIGDMRLGVSEDEVLMAASGTAAVNCSLS